MNGFALAALVSSLLGAGSSFALTSYGGQGHDLKAPDALKGLSFMIGDWKGKQNFNAPGQTLVGDATNHVHMAIGGHYLEETLSTVIGQRPPTDTHHYITFDPATAQYKAWWFNDTSVGPMELDGTAAGSKLVLESPATSARIFRATYDSPSPDQLKFRLELKNGNDWQLLFETDYTK